MHVESNKTKTFRPLLLCMINTPHGLSEYTNIWVHPIKTFLWQHILRIPFFYIRPKNRLHFYTPCQVLVINLDKTSSMAKFSWSFVRWAMLQTVNWVILPNGMMQNTLQLIMPQVCHITCSAILPALTLSQNVENRKLTGTDVTRKWNIDLTWFLAQMLSRCVSTKLSPNYFLFFKFELRREITWLAGAWLPREPYKNPETVLCALS